MGIKTEKIKKIEKVPYTGYLYNLTTETGNLLANNILVKNSGGLGTPPHERIIPGMVHRANRGVLFIDEIAILSPKSQQELLTVLQEKKYPITGQSEHSSGAMTRSEPVPADFVLVAAGNEETIAKMHPALRSRIRGYGYEIHINHDMDDTEENKLKIAQFIAQEVIKDKKIPHFSREAVREIISEAKRRSGTSGKLTLHLRELGGLIRAAGDLAIEEGKEITERIHVLKAKSLARPLEQQLADKYIEQKKKYQVIISKGLIPGRVNGLAVMGSATSLSGIVIPIESEVTPGSSQKIEIIATGKLGKIAQEAVQNVSATILKYFGKNLKEKYNIFVQFLYAASGGGVEGDSASISVATAIVSAFTKAPVKQNYAMTGSLSVRGDVLAVGGVTQKIEAAIEAGLTHVIIPKTNERDVIIPAETKNKIKIIPVNTIEEVLKHALDWKGKEKIRKKLK
ncbi:MAG: ATP-dependent protease LonB [Nanoarchaeota archaeon]|jgi:Lon-like ATP-dependent protease|nr:ATP-dependent protease LonB [Nanoarchaeota archaeon]|tara:strand:+ start:34729 stop:36093 length:1365 start_codon:yes stop_codon:yes gene_type:complete